MTILRKLFGKYLLVTNTVTCGVMMGVGDVIQQFSEHCKQHNYPKFFTMNSGYVMAASPEKEDGKIIISLSEATSNNKFYQHDYLRTRNMVMVGLLQGPFHHWFYMVLERILPGRSPKSVVKKTFLDQLIASPTCLILFFAGLGLMEKRKLCEISSELKLKLYDTWKVDCCFWPPTQSVNFFFVPLHFRVLYINFMTMVYDIFLSYIKYDAQF